MNTLFSRGELHAAVRLLASRSLIRLITEIDGNGAIPPRRLSGILLDVSRHRLRRTIEAARAHGLVRVVPGTGLELTEAGVELADLYDASARWARHHAYPAPTCDFSSRISHCLRLLEPSLATDLSGSPSHPDIEDLDSAEAEADLCRPRALLVQWLAAHPHIAASRFELAA
ncbi:regulator [Streptomyces sp. NPDC047024]|uniref:regulator n=1 Tax=Streptomyces sp. NPDC047024 TaxID=3155476 RepID=UPI00340824EA